MLELKMISYEVTMTRAEYSQLMARKVADTMLMHQLMMDQLQAQARAAAAAERAKHQELDGITAKWLADYDAGHRSLSLAGPFF